MRKGIFFTVVMVVFLFALSLALIKWSQGSKMHEYRVSRHVYLDSVITASQILSDERIEKFSLMAARHAVFKLANYTSSPYDPSLSESHRLRTQDDVPIALAGLMFNGSAPGSLFGPGTGSGEDLNYSEEEMMYTFKSFRENAQDVCDAVGWVCNISEPYDVNIYQDSPWSVRFNFTINKTIRDPTGKYSINSQPVKISVNVSIIGMPDPLTTQLARAGAPGGSDPNDYYRLIYRSPTYTSIHTMWFGSDNPSAYASKGFVYGVVTRNPDINASKAWKYIFVGNNNELPSDFEKFGGLIIEKVEYDSVNSSGTWSRDYSYDCDPPTPGVGTVHCVVDYINTTQYEKDCRIDCINITYVSSVDSSVSYGDGECSGYDVSSYCEGQFLTDSSFGSVARYSIDKTYSIPYIKLENTFNDISDGFESLLYNGNEYYPETGHGILINSYADVNITSGLPSSCVATSYPDPSCPISEAYDNLTIYQPILYNIEPLRDMAVCGFFVESGRAPSFFQRMVVNGDELNSAYGIESFAVGRWAIDDSTDPDVKWSNVDFIYHKCWRGGSCPAAYKIKGMPGCKNKIMCSSNNPNEDGIGHFALDDSSASEYGVKHEFVCGSSTPGDGMAPCE